MAQLANPSLPYLPSLKAEIKALAAAARRDGVMLQSFKSLRLNMGAGRRGVRGAVGSRCVGQDIEGEAAREGEYILGLDLGGSTAQSAAAVLGGLRLAALRAFAVFPERPNLATRATNDGAGNLYEECHRRGELLLGRGSPCPTSRSCYLRHLTVGARPAAIAADRFKKSRANRTT